MSHPSLLPWVSITLTILLNVMSMAYITGTVMTRLSAVEDQAKDAKKMDEKFTTLAVKMAGVESKLGSIDLTLGRLEQALTRGK